MENKFHYRFAIPYPWPEMKMGAEYELIKRFQIAAKEENMECIVISNDGHLMNEDLQVQEARLDPETIDFVLSIHFLTYKTMDAFYYHALWNPPEIPLDSTDYHNIIDNYVMCDDFLIYDHGSMTDHLKSMLWGKERNLEGASSLLTSFPESVVMTPNLDNPQLFYCGINWDVLEHGHGRNESVMKLLDRSGIVRIYGPETAWGGIRPWEGYASYQGELPYDGHSLIERLNQCGICLVLSSDVHRRAGAVTNRAFEACAAGAVIISDDNQLAKEMFEDTALYIDYNKNNPKDTVEQIIENYNWIINNKEKALKMANDAQKRFLKKYALNKHLRDIYLNHSSRINGMKKDFYAINEGGNISVTYILNEIDVNEAYKKLDCVISNINRQDYKNITLVIGMDRKLQSIASEKKYQSNNIHFVKLDLYNHKHVKIMTNGEVFSQLRYSVKHEYFMQIDDNEIWFKDHVTTLVRALEDDEESIFAYSGCLIEHNKVIEKRVFCKINWDAFYKLCKNEDGSHYYEEVSAGRFLFRSTIHDMIPAFIFTSLDGHEGLAIMDILHNKYKKDGAFTRRMTMITRACKKSKYNQIIPAELEYKYINGLTKYEKPARESDEDSRRRILRWIADLPLKPYIKLRYYRTRIRLESNPNCKQKLIDKYNRCLERYLQL